MSDAHINAIVNDDGTTGYITSANKYLTTDDYNKKYALLKLLSDKENKNFNKVAAGGTIGKLTEENAGLKTGYNLVNFLTKLQKFQFNPPSDNLWIVRIYTYDEKGGVKDMVSLYNAVIEANKSYSSVVPTKWKVTIPQTKDGITPNINPIDYIEDFQQSTGVFLAQNINFTPQSAISLDQTFNQGKQHSAFLNFGYVVQGRQINRSLKISFLVSNWDITDILFEPWIAAVAQRGMIQDGKSSSIKARIILEEYSASIPKQFKSVSNDRNEMQCRKQYIFEDCVPINRGSIERDYDFNNAGTFKSSIVQFRFQDYQIKYLI